jgi:predicted ester cyclase
MSTKENKALILRFWEEVNKGNPDAWDELCAPGYVYHGTGGDMTMEQSKKHAAGLLSAFPDLKVKVDNIVSEGDHLAIRYTIRGTHRGAYQGIAPTGKRIKLGGMEVDRIADGKFIETWGISDVFGLMQNNSGQYPEDNRLKDTNARTPTRVNLEN